MANDKDDKESRDKHRRSGFPFDALISSLPGFASQTFARAVGQSGNFLDSLLKAPEYMEQIGKAGSYLKDMREVAGLTIDDLAKAVDIENLDLLHAIEEGRSPITLDILYRLASFYSRNDPVTFTINFSREYAPWLWQVLRVTGIEKILISAERELKFINIYRSRESARHLSDEDFDKMLGFVRGGFNMAMDFIEPQRGDPETSGNPADRSAATKTKPTTIRSKTATVKNPSRNAKTSSDRTKTATARKTTGAGPRKAPTKKPSRSRAAPKN